MKLATKHNLAQFLKFVVPTALLCFSVAIYHHFFGDVSEKFLLFTAFISLLTLDYFLRLEYEFKYALGLSSWKFKKYREYFKRINWKLD